jgi:hypothetical protein
VPGLKHARREERSRTPVWESYWRPWLTDPFYVQFPILSNLLSVQLVHDGMLNSPATNSALQTRFYQPLSSPRARTPTFSFSFCSSFCTSNARSRSRCVPHLSLSPSFCHPIRSSISCMKAAISANDGPSASRAPN